MNTLPAEPIAVWAYQDNTDHHQGVLITPNTPVGHDWENTAFRAASILKPIIAWISRITPHYINNPLAWATDAAGAILVSNNASTNALCDNVGGVTQLLKLINDTAGTHLKTDGTELTAATFGRILITASDVTHLYHKLATAAQHNDPAAQAILTWMSQTLPSQRFGATPTGNYDPVKCGWDINSDETLLRTHAVRIHQKGTNIQVAAVLTALRLSSDITPDAYINLYTTGYDVSYINNSIASATIAEGMLVAFANE